MRTFFSIIIVIFIFSNGFAQTNQFYIKAGTQIPFQHNVGAEFVLNNQFGFQLQYGLLTTPYEGNIKRVVAFFEDNENLLRIIEDSFQHGSILGAGFNYHFKRNYMGGFGQYISLRNTSTASAALQAYYGYDFSFLDFITGPINLTLQSNLYNAGLLYGRRFTLMEPALQLHLELGVSKNFASRNNMQSSRPSIDNLGIVENLYDRLDKNLRETFSSYVIIPTFNVYIVYNLTAR